MFVDILFDEEQAALRLAFDRACSELGIGTNSDDADRRERLARLILRLAQGESEPTLIQHKAVWQMKHPDSASSVGQKTGVHTAATMLPTRHEKISTPFYKDGPPGSCPSGRISNSA